MQPTKRILAGAAIIRTIAGDAQRYNRISSLYHTPIERIIKEAGTCYIMQAYDHLIVLCSTHTGRIS